MGQAAGVAAAMAVRQGQSVREIDVSRLRDCLMQIGAVI
jgi:hypothetical protein